MNDWRAYLQSAWHRVWPMSIAPMSPERWGLVGGGAALLCVTLAFEIGAAQLKEWQTLMASLIALGAATIAYRAAMAKVNFDRELAEQELLRRKTGLYLRLEFALKVLASEAISLAKATDWAIQAPYTKLPIKDITIHEVPEIKEAWDHLELFTRYMAIELQRMRAGIRILEIMAKRNPLGDVEVDRRNRTCIEIKHYSSAIAEACNNIISQIHAQIGIDAHLAVGTKAHKRW